MAHKTSNINIQVGLDENNIPEQLRWEASDTGEKAAEAKAILMSIWDEKTKETLRIDLWTKDMPVNDMFILYHQNLMGMATSLEKSTGEEKLAQALRDYCSFFAEKTKILG